MWRRNTVVFTTSLRAAPSVASCASRLVIAWRSSEAVPPDTICWSAMPTWPDTISQSPARTMGVYGPAPDDEPSSGQARLVHLDRQAGGRECVAVVGPGKQGELVALGEVLDSRPAQDQVVEVEHGDVILAFGDRQSCRLELGLVDEERRQVADSPGVGLEPRFDGQHPAGQEVASHRGHGRSEPVGRAGVADRREQAGHHVELLTEIEVDHVGDLDAGARAAGARRRHHLGVDVDSHAPRLGCEVLEVAAGAARDVEERCRADARGGDPAQDLVGLGSVVLFRGAVEGVVEIHRLVEHGPLLGRHQHACSGRKMPSELPDPQLRRRRPVGQAGGRPWASQAAAATAANTASEPFTGEPSLASISTPIGGVSTARSTPKLRIVRSWTSPRSSTASPSLQTHPTAMCAAPTQYERSTTSSSGSPHDTATRTPGSSPNATVARASAPSGDRTATTARPPPVSTLTTPGPAGARNREPPAEPAAG